MPWLLDTSALSEPMRKAPDPGFMTKLAGAAGAQLYTSSICVMELRYGCALRKNARLWSAIEREILNRVQVIAFGEPEAARAGDILAALSRSGTPIGIEDVQIGATALVHGLTVLTGNVKHFSRISGLSVENWLSH